MCDFVIWVCEVRWWCWWWWYDYVWVKFLRLLLLILFNHTVPLIVFGHCAIERLLRVVAVVRLAEACQISVFYHPELFTVVESVNDWDRYVLRLSFKKFSKLTQFPRQLQCHAKRRMQFWEISNLDDRNRHELARCSLNMNGWRSGWRFRRNSRRDSAVECGNFQWKSD